MKLKEVIGCARCVVTEDVVCPTNHCYNGLGINPPPNLDKYRAVNVVGPKPSIQDDVVTRTKRIRVEIHTNINGKTKRIDALPRRLEGFESFSFVLEYEKHHGSSSDHHFKLFSYARAFAGIRFGACKELMHIMTNQVRSNMEDMFDSLDDEKKFRDRFSWHCQCANDWMTMIPQDEEEDFSSDETACWYLAVETTLPWRLNNQFVSFHDGSASADDPWLSDEIEKAAEAFVVPKEIVEHVVNRSFCIGSKTLKPYRFVSAYLNMCYDNEESVDDQYPLWCAQKCRSPVKRKKKR